jgi:hypothetical protein
MESVVNKSGCVISLISLMKTVHCPADVKHLAYTCRPLYGMFKETITKV